VWITLGEPDLVAEVMQQPGCGLAREQPAHELLPAQRRSERDPQHGALLGPAAVHRAGRDLGRVAGSQVARLAVDDKRVAAADDLERLGLRWVHVLAATATAGRHCI